MKQFVLCALGALAICVISERAKAEELATERAHNWHSWRGPNADGVAPHANPPVEWSETKNIKWKVEIPGRGISTPIIWNDRVFVLTAIDTGRKGKAAPDPAAKPEPSAKKPQPPANQSKKRRRGRRRFFGSQPPTNVFQFVIMCLDRKTGKEIWSRTANELVPHEGFHRRDNSFASGSPTTDGRYLYASFGSYGIYCYDFEGNQIWKRDLGNMRTRAGFGEGTSPTLYRNRLIVSWDHEGPSFIAALDTADGKTKWKIDRDERTAWATPLVVEHNGRTQVIANATNRVRSYNLDNGELFWECGGQTTNTIPSPVTTDGKVICMSGFRGQAIFAIPLDATGDLTDTEGIAWHHDRSTDYRPGTPYVPSPLLYGDLLYFTKSNTGILSCLSARTGEVVFDNKRLGLQKVYASPVGAADRIYIVGRDGSTVVLKRGPKFELLATNTLDDSIDASPAIVGGEIFLRSKKHVYCIAEK